MSTEPERQILPDSVIDEAWSEFVYPRAAVDLARPSHLDGFNRAMRVVAQWAASRAAGAFYEVRGDVYNDALVEVRRLVNDQSLTRGALTAAVDEVILAARGEVGRAASPVATDIEKET